jgi:hypothetical protein
MGFRMSKSLLHQLFDGEIYPSENIILNEPRIKELQNKIYNEMEYFESILSSEDWKRFEELNDTQSDIFSAYDYAYFSNGFRLAVRLIIEGFANGETIVLNEKSKVGGLG